MRAPVLGGNFGVWGGLFSTFDCAVKGIRKKEDPYNAIIAGFFTGGSLAIRGGYKAARNGAIGCAVLLAVIEGVGIAFSKMMAGSTKLEVSLDQPLDTLVDQNLTKTCTGTTTAARQRPGHGMNEQDLKSWRLPRHTALTSSLDTSLLPRATSPCSGTTPVFHTENGHDLCIDLGVLGVASYM